MKVLFCLEGFFPRHKAGTEVYVLNLARYLASRGVSVAVLISTSDDISDYHYEEIPVFTFRIPGKPIAEELNGLIPPRGIDAFIEKVKQINPVLVHFHSVGRAVNSFHIQEVKRLGFKTVFTAHLGSNICIKGDFIKFDRTLCNGRVVPTVCLACQFKKRGIPEGLALVASNVIHAGLKINRKLLPPGLHQASHRKQELERIKANTDVIIAISPWIGKALNENRISENVQLVRQGIDKFFVESKLSSRHAVNGPVKLAFVGRMHPHKGFHLLRAALDNIAGTRWTLTVATLPVQNELPYYTEMRGWANNNPNVEWRENEPKEVIVNLLDGVDLLILPSVSNEMAPLIVLEAFARRVPVLGSDYPAIADMISAGVNGQIFKNGSSADLENKLNDVLNDPHLLDTWSSNITTPRTFDEVGQDMLKIYNQILG